MGLLSDIYSYGDGLKRQLSGLLADPGGTIDLGVQRFKDQQNGLLNTMQMAYPMAGQRSVMNSPDQQAAARATLADAGAQQGMAGVIGYHGTMTPGFDKFNLKHFGKTDDGWLGKGVYAAQSPVDASSYAQVNHQFGGAVYKVDMNLKNPLDISWEAANRSELLAKRQKLGPEGFSQWLTSQGHDGVKFTGPSGALNSAGHRDVQYMAIDPNDVSLIGF